MVAVWLQSSLGEMACSVLQQAWPSEGTQHVIPRIGVKAGTSQPPVPALRMSWSFLPGDKLNRSSVSKGHCVSPPAWWLLITKWLLGRKQTGRSVGGSVQPVAAVVLQQGLPESPPPCAPGPSQNHELPHQESIRQYGDCAGSGHGSSLQCCFCTNSRLALEQLSVQ